MTSHKSIEFNPKELYSLVKCRDCPNAVIEIDRVAEKIDFFFQEVNYSENQRQRLGRKPKHHDIFQVAIAGCPNSCSQPQIKDFGLQGQVIPEIGVGCSGCGLCVSSCPDNCINLLEEGPEIDRTSCLNCGKCIGVCPTGTIYKGNEGFRVIHGGKLGRRPVLAREISKITDEQGVLEMLRQTLELMQREAVPGERLGSLLERIQQVKK